MWILWFGSWPVKNLLRWKLPVITDRIVWGCVACRRSLRAARRHFFSYWPRFSPKPWWRCWDFARHVLRLGIVLIALGIDCILTRLAALGNLWLWLLVNTFPMIYDIWCGPTHKTRVLRLYPTKANLHGNTTVARRPPQPAQLLSLLHCPLFGIQRRPLLSRPVKPSPISVLRICYWKSSTEHGK
jgi:hypothetical protein